MGEYRIDSEIMGHHEYQLYWNLVIGEELVTSREPDDMKDAFAVCVPQGEKIVGHLKKGDKGQFAKTVFYFLCADPYNRYITSITGKRLNHGGGMGMSVVYPDIPW